MSYGFNIAENCHVVNCIPATTSGGATDYVGDYIHMEGAAHVDFIVSYGATAATGTILVFEATNASGGSATRVAAAYYAEATALGDTLTAKAALTTSGLLTSANDSIFYVISVDASDLSDGCDWVTVKCCNAGVNSVCAVAVMSGLRYATSPGLTAIV